MKPDLIIFNIEGTLLDTESILMKAYEVTLRGMNIKYDKVQLYNLVRKTVKTTEEKLNEYYGSEIITEMVKYSKDAVFKRILKDEEVSIKSGVQTLLGYLKEKKYKLAIGTSLCKNEAVKRLKDAKILEYFSYMVAREDIEKDKPSPEIFFKIAKYFNASPEKCIVFECSPVGILAAKSARMIPLLAPSIVEPTEEMLIDSYKILGKIESAITILD